MLKSQIEEKFNNKSILILGFGKEGISTYKFLRKMLPKIKLTIADANIRLKDNYSITGDNNLSFILGENYLTSLNDFDIIFKTPGISLKNIRFNENIITSQTDLFLQLYSEQIIGITGTKGKSTTSCLIYEILSSFNNNTILVGNIGTPPLDCIDKINKDTLIVAELSSHQLQFITKAPKYSILLNIFQEHLDHYNSYIDYQLSKFNILLKQTKDDYFIYHANDEIINELILEHEDIKANLYPYSLTDDISQGCSFNDGFLWFNKTYKVYDINLKRHLKGEHNLLNIMAIINVCKLLNISDKYIIDGINNFKGLPHRIEFVGKVDDIEFYNDSIATIPEATISAVKSIPNVETLIIGGYDRGIDYSKLIEFIINSAIINIIFIDTAGKRIMFEMNNFPHNPNQDYFYVDKLSDAVKLAKIHTRKHNVCLLSPAAASYGMFVNFEDRGNQFKKLVFEKIN